MHIEACITGYSPEGEWYWNSWEFIAETAMDVIKAVRNERDQLISEGFTDLNSTYFVKL